MGGTGESPRSGTEKAERHQARGLIVAYHQEQLRVLLEHVRGGFVRLDSGEIDEFELDDLIYRYKRAAAELWKFCDASGERCLRAARTLAHWQEQDDEPDWWEVGAPRRRQS